MNSEHGQHHCKGHQDKDDNPGGEKMEGGNDEDLEEIVRQGQGQCWNLV